MHDSLTKQITATKEGMRLWQRERVIVDITERICELMQQAGVTRAGLAVALGKSRSHVTQILSGRSNLTLGTISDVYLALNRQFEPGDGPISLAPLDAPKLLCFTCADEDQPDDEGAMEMTLNVN
jgi:transcriptional regulator with XRE-family HTH domain